MYSGYLFIIAFAMLVTSAVSDNTIPTKLDGNKISMHTDDLCKQAGFVKKPPAALKHTSTVNNGDSPMSVTAIMLTCLGGMVAVLGAGMLALYLHNKKKLN